MCRNTSFCLDRERAEEAHLRASRYSLVVRPEGSRLRGRRPRPGSRSYVGPMTELTCVEGLLGNRQGPNAGGEPDGEEELDAYSRTVVAVAARVTPSVASL